MVEESIKNSESKIIDENKSGYGKQQPSPSLQSDQQSAKDLELDKIDTIEPQLQQHHDKNGKINTGDDDLNKNLNVDVVSIAPAKSTPTITAAASSTTATKYSLPKINIQPDTGIKTVTPTALAITPNNIEPENNKNLEKLTKSVKISCDNDDAARKKRLEKQLDDDRYEMVPPDGGWGWLVLGGSMLVNILVPGTIKSFGVLFVEFLEAFQATPSTAAWIPALCYFLYSSLGPLSSILSVKYSYRTVTLIGGTFAAAGMIITFWATSINYLYVSYGVMVGIGAGLSFPPTVYIVTSYFVRLRGLANGLCISGSALGSIILPPVLRYLLETFGYRGAVLIMGGITLNVWVAAIFYEPVEKHLKRVLKKEYRNGGNGALALVDDDIDKITEESENSEDRDKDTPLKAKFVITSDDTPVSTPTLEHKSPDVFRFPKNDLGFARSASAAAVQNFIKSEEVSRHRKISTPIKEENRNPTFSSQLSSSPSLNIPESMSSYSRLNRFQPQRSSGNRPPKRSPSTSSFQYVSTPYHGSTLSALQPSEFASRLSLKSMASSLNPVASCTKSADKKTKSNMSSFFDLSLLKDPTYLVILISNSTNAIGYTNFIILLPAYALTMGFDKSLAAYLLSTVSTLDLVGRIGGSALSDTNLIPKTWYFVGGLSMSGLALAILPLTSSYTMVSIVCALFGLASGTYVGITAVIMADMLGTERLTSSYAVIMADMLGTERLTSSYGISLFVNGILQLIGPPICGLIFEEIGRYQPLFMTLGFILLGGSALWGFMPIINRNKLKKQSRELEQETEKGLLA